MTDHSNSTTCRDDISEKRNLAKKSPEIAKSLNRKLSHWLKETNAPMPALLANP